MENVLEVRKVRKSYEGFVLDDVSFSLPTGYIMGLIGPNGAGKTTLIKLILDVARLDSGEIRVFGNDSRFDGAGIRSRIGFVHETGGLPEYLTLAQIGAIVAPFYRQWDDQQFRRLAGEFELPLRRRLGTLSRGMKTRFSLVLSLCHHAQLIILDEPSSGLDPVFRHELLERLSALIQNEEKSVLFSTHITSDLERIADYITLIHRGRLVFSSSRDDVFENWVVVKGGRELLNEIQVEFFRGVQLNPYGFEALSDDPAEARRRFSSRAVIEKPSLEDLMFLITRPCAAGFQDPIVLSRTADM
ncbi:MAG: ABC transporter ATP-binding protein [Acidobacteria bacterium]|nr:MAG: ABC transporter ATP-binding protein [Acidobacteriota bacterium]